jgi:hypothetical protein
VKHKYRKHRTLITVVAKKTLYVGETSSPDSTLAVCFTTGSRDILSGDPCRTAPDYGYAT